MDEFTGENEDLNEVKNRPLGHAKEKALDLDFQFTPNNPYTLSVDAKSLGQSEVAVGDTYKPTFFETASAEAAEFNASFEYAHALSTKLEDPSPFDDLPDPKFNPKADPSKYININNKYLGYVFDAKSDKDLNYRIQRTLEEQQHDAALENGSIPARILGGLIGMVTDPISYIPIVGWAKYAKFAPTVLRAMGRALPGVASSSILQAGGKQLDKINGNLTDFFTEAAINTVFGTALFGVGGALGLTAEKMNLWNLQKFAIAHVDGLGFKMAVDEAGKITGLRAFDQTGGSLSAAKVTHAQALADSEFSKSGIFKVPYLNDALIKFMSMPGLGSPLPRLLTSKYQTVRGFIDRAVDHNIITKDLEQGGTSPIKFETLMKQQYSSLRLLDAQMNALHLERNGFSIENRAAAGAAQLGLSVKQKSMELLSKDLEKSAYVGKDTFYSEIENVLINEVPSEHAAINEAAAMLRTKIDDTYKSWRTAYNLPEEWLSPKTAAGYLMRVYDTPFMNTNEGKWIDVVSNWLKESDDLITTRMNPIREMENRISTHKVKHEQLIRGINKTDEQVKLSVQQFDALKIQKKVLEEQLQNELRTNPDLNIHVEDSNALSADEAKQLKALTKRLDIAAKEIDVQKKVIQNIKEESSKRKASAMKGKTVKTAKKKLRESDTGALVLEKEEAKLKELVDEHYQEELNIQESIARGEVNPRLYVKEKDSQRFLLKDPAERLKLRKEYDSHYHREVHAKAYFDTIMNQTAEDTINQVMGRLGGVAAENHLKQRTLLIPDDLLYKHSFMSKDLMSKVSNYVVHLSRRTNLKNVYNDVTVNGGVESLFENLNTEYNNFRKPLNEKKELLSNKLETAKSEEKKESIKKQIKKVERMLAKETQDFDKAKENITHVYEKMMGLKKVSKKAKQIQSGIMSFTAMSSLAFLPFSMINDLSANGLQHGIWPFIRDGVYPIAQSLGGILKTKDSEALRRSAPSVNLALQDVLTGYADRNWSMYTEPYLNMGKFVGGLEKLAHFSSNFTLTNYFDNGLQRIAGSICQGEFMRILHAFKAGEMTKKEGLYLRKYGINPEKWSDRMITAFESDGGGKTAIGGYKANFWQWQDMEAANEFSNAVYRGIQSTTIARGLVDSPFWADNVMGSLIHGFSGWMFASLNRYVIPSMQQPDAQKLMGILFMLGTGYFVSPFRRLARGEDAFPENQTDGQRLFETVSDSGYFSFFNTILQDANLASGGRLLGDLKNDKFRDRTRVGLFGPSFGKANQMFDIITAASSNEFNEADALKMFRMLPVMNSSWTWLLSKKLVEGLGLPKTRAEAHRQKG